jgi:hypothetical protein
MLLGWSSKGRYEEGGRREEGGGRMAKGGGRREKGGGRREERKEEEGGMRKSIHDKGWIVWTGSSINVLCVPLKYATGLVEQGKVEEGGRRRGR